MRVSPNTTLPVRASVWTVSRSLAVTNDIADCFLFLPILRCFSSRRSPLRKAIARGFLFGNPEFFASVRLPRAFRSLARPSSALEPSYSPASVVATQIIRVSSVLDHVRADSLSAELVQWTSGSHVHMVSSHPGWSSRVFDPSHPRLHGMVHQFRRTPIERPLPYKGNGSRFEHEPWTHRDSNPGHPPCKGGTLPLSYGPTPLAGRGVCNC